MAKKIITKKAVKLFLAEMRRSGSVTKAAEKAGITRCSWYELRKRDTHFMDQWNDNEMEYMDKIEKEAIRRAVKGVVEKRPYTHYSGDDKETRMHPVRKYSDKLIATILIARHPSYKPVQTIDLNNPDGRLKPIRDTSEYAGLTDEELLTLTRLQRKAHEHAANKSGN